MNQMQMNFQLETSPLFMISAYSFIICLHLYTAILKTVCMGKKFWASLFFFNAHWGRQTIDKTNYSKNITTYDIIFLVIPSIFNTHFLNYYIIGQNV